METNLGLLILMDSIFGKSHELRNKEQEMQRQEEEYPIQTDGRGKGESQEGQSKRVQVHLVSFIGFN